MKSVCSICNYENRPENLFCTQCGSKLNNKIRHAAKLVMLNGGKDSTVFGLNGDRTTLGRDQNSAIVIRDDHVSKNHASIYYESDDYWIEDLDSKNGVYLNGKLISERAKLYEGSLIKLGSTILRFEGFRQN